MLARKRDSKLTCRGRTFRISISAAALGQVFVLRTRHFAAAVSPDNLCLAAFTDPKAPLPTVPLTIQLLKMKSHGDGVAEMSGGGNRPPEIVGKINSQIPLILLFIQRD
jgi:hypothetical protein